MSYSAWCALLRAPGAAGTASAGGATSLSSSSIASSTSIHLHYLCSCSRLHPHLSYLFWCKSCSSLQCHSCVSTQVDTYYCPACLNSVFTTPAAANQNRCEQCVECPSCSQILSPALSSSASYYIYNCEYCKWSSEEYRPAGIDPASAAASAKYLIATESNQLSMRVKEFEQNTQANNAFTQILSHYRLKSSLHNAANSKALSSSSTVSLLSSSSSLNSLQTSFKRTQQQQQQVLYDEFETLLAESDAANPLLGGGIASNSLTSTTTEDESTVNRWMSWRSERDELLRKQHYQLSREEVRNVFEPIPHALLGYEKEGEEVASLSQRLLHPSGPHLHLHSLVPRRAPLSTKLAHRCCTCNKFLVKPGPGASKPNMEIHMAAMNFIPEVKVGMAQGGLRAGTKSSMILYFKNPLERVTKLWLTLPNNIDTETETATENDSSLPPSPSPHPAATCTVEFPRVSTLIAAYDDLPEESVAPPTTVPYPSASPHSQSPDEKKQSGDEESTLVVYRHLNRVGLQLHVTPHSTTEPTQFVLLVHVQPENSTTTTTTAPAVASPSPVAATSAVPDVITFPLYVTLGTASE